MSSLTSVPPQIHAISMTDLYHLEMKNGSIVTNEG